MLFLARADGGIVLQKHTSKMIYLSCIQLIIVRAAPVCGTDPHRLLLSRSVYANTRSLSVSLISSIRRKNNKFLADI